MGSTFKPIFIVHTALKESGNIQIFAKFIGRIEKGLIWQNTSSFTKNRVKFDQMG